MSEVEILRGLLLAQAQRLRTALFDRRGEERDYREMHKPQIGDFVAVLPAIRGVDFVRCIGILREVSLASKPDEDPIDFVIERLDGQRQRWENASAVKLFTHAWPGHPPLVVHTPESKEKR